MYKDAAPSEEPVPHFDTPESAQECLDLAKAIDGQLQRWSGYRREDFTDTPTPNLALYITEDNQPLGREPKNYMKDARKGLIQYDTARELTDYERRRQLLSQWVVIKAVDDAPAHHVELANYLKAIEMSATNPWAREEYLKAAQELHRLFIIREQLALKIGRIATLDLSRFADVARKLDDDFM